MSRNPRRRGFTAPRPSMSRPDWLAFAAEASHLAHAVRSGAAVERPALFKLYQRAGVAAECELPVLAEGKSHAKAALVAAVKGLAVDPRAAWAQAVEGAAAVVTDLVVEAQTAAAGGWKRQSGGEA